MKSFLRWVLPVIVTLMPISAQQIFLSMPDVASCGELKTGTFPRWFGTFASGMRWTPVNGFSLGAENGTQPPSNTAKPEPVRALLYPILIEKILDSCTPGLLRAATLGTVGKGAIYITRGGADDPAPSPQLFIRFETMIVASSQFTSTSSGTPSESVTVKAGKISFTFEPISAAGRKQDPICFGWDYAENTEWRDGCSL